MSKIKTQFDLLYEIRPRQRSEMFSNPPQQLLQLIYDFKTKQESVVYEYLKDGGIKDILSIATGKDSIE